MKMPPDRDPRRWKDTPASASGIDVELAVAARLLHEAPPPDELRLIQLAREVTARQRSEARPAGMWARAAAEVWMVWLVWLAAGARPWRRTAALVVVSLFLGGVATAVSGNIIQHFKDERRQAAMVALARTAPAGAGAAKRRWRMQVNRPTSLDLWVGPEGTEVDVVDGRADITGTDVPGTLELAPGATWRLPQSAATADPGATAGSAAGATAPPPQVPPGASTATATLSRPPSAPDSATVVAPSSHPLAGSPSSLGRAAKRMPPPVGRLALADPGPESTAPAPAAVAPPGARKTTAKQDALAATPATEPPPLILPGRGAVPDRGGSKTSGGLVAPAVKLRPSMAPARPAVAEATLVARAFGRLRRDHDPLWALADLDEHDRQYPGGTLRRESALARAEALLALDRNGEALIILDGVQLENRADRRALLARAELREQEGRRSEAIADFDRVLTDGGSDALAARALYGRATCRLRGGDLGGARADLRAYVERFPESEHRNEAEKTLQRLGG